MTLALVLLMVCGLCHASDRSDGSIRSEGLLCSFHDKQLKEIPWYPNFSDNSAFSPHMRQQMAPYLLPLDHPLKPVVDSIFSRSRVIKNEDTLQKAGFTILFSQKISRIIVASHPKVKGYLFKIYLDSRNVRKGGKVGWQLLTTRCMVAEKIRHIIAQKHIRHFTVADKWLYPLPTGHSGSHQEPVVLLVKDMHIHNRRESEKAWREGATKAQLQELYAILSQGYGSACLPKNVPYTKDGTFAFIDTEYNKRKIPLHHVLKYTSKKMGAYWRRLVLAGSN